MNLATLILPNADNAGVELNDVHASLRLDLLDTFGGFTATQALGGWRNDRTGTVHVEPATVYSIAMDSSAEDAAKLDSVARHYAAMAAQDCVMVVHADGVVAFISPTSAYETLASF